VQTRHKEKLGAELLLAYPKEKQQKTLDGYVVKQAKEEP